MGILCVLIGLTSALMVILEDNSMLCIFYLVLSFISIGFFWIGEKLDFIGLLLIIIYVGAIAILFLFVVMMINTKLEYKSLLFKFSPFGLIIIFIIISELSKEFYSCNIFNYYKIFDLLSINGQITNISSLPELMYSWSYLMYSSLILLVAMIGAITLTLNHNLNVKRQTLFQKW